MTIVRALDNCSIDKITAFMNWYWWRDTDKAAKSIYLRYLICPKYNPGKLVHNPLEYLKLPNGPFEFWQVDFTQLPSSHAYKYVLVMAYMFYHWIKAFHCRQANASKMAKVLLEKIIFSYLESSSWTQWSRNPFYWSRATNLCYFVFGHFYNICIVFTILQLYVKLNVLMT